MNYFLNYGYDGRDVFMLSIMAKNEVGGYSILEISLLGFYFIIGTEDGEY